GPAFDLATSSRKRGFDSRSSLTRSSSSVASKGWIATNRWSGNSTTMTDPESAHSISAAVGSAARRLNGIVLMSTELLPGDDQLVADLPPHHGDDDFPSFDVVQNPEITRSQFVLSHGIGAQPLHGTRKGHRLVLKSSEDRCLQSPLIAWR